MVMWYFVAFAYAKDINVSPNGTNDALYNAIKEANSGDKILLEAGSYKECVNTLGKDLILQGQAGAKIIGNGSCDYALTVETGQVIIKSLNFSHRNKGCIIVKGRQASLHLYDLAASDCGGTNSNGGAVSLVGGTLYAKDTRFTRNKGSKGAAIYGKGAAITLENVIISENMAQIGGGVFLSDSEATISSSRIFGNKTKAGGFGAAIALRESSLFKLEGTSLQNNHAQGKGGALYIDNTAQASANRVDILNSEFSANSASFGSSAGGAIYARNALKLNITDSNLSENLAAVSGGAIFLYDVVEDVNITNTVFEKNRARGGAGGAIVIAASEAQKASELKITNGTFEGNRAGGYGGAISNGNSYNLFGSLAIFNSKFERNYADSSRSGAGGAIYYVSSEPFTLRVEDSSFISNRAELTGGAIYAYQPQMLWIERSVFMHNEAVGPSTVGPRYGGAVMADGVKIMSVEDSQFCHNIVSSSGSERTSGTGGAIYVQKTDRIDLFNNRLWENEAQQYGGAIAFDTIERSSIINNSLVGNKAALGGAMHTRNSDVKVINTIFAYTQGGIAVVSDTGEWLNNNWYNNIAGHSQSFLVPDKSMNDVELRPDFVRIVIDGRCDDEIRVQSNSPLQNLGLQGASSLDKIGSD
jgi:hypothetical protein